MARSPWRSGWPSARSGCGANASREIAWPGWTTGPTTRGRGSTRPRSRPSCWCWPARSRPIWAGPARPTGPSWTWRGTWASTRSWGWGRRARAPSGSSSGATSCDWTVFDSWMAERDPGFLEQAVGIIELLLGPPAPGRPARREFEYVRDGTVDLLAAFRVSDGQVTGLVRAQHRSREFCELLD